MENEGMSAAERRRAARQRKILENADSRMNRLYGRPVNADPVLERDKPAPASAAFDPCPDPPEESIDEVLSRSRAAAVPPGWPAGLGGAPPGMEELLRQMNGQQRMGGAGFGAGMDGDGDETGAPASRWWRLWDRYRWAAVALVALLTRLAPLLGVGLALTQNVLVPFLVLETLTYVIRLWAVPLRTNMGLLGTALMLCGVSPRTLDLWGRYITFLTQAWSDFMVYMFVLVLAYRFGGDGGAALPAESGTGSSQDVGQMAAPPPPPPDDNVEYEF